MALVGTVIGVTMRLPLLLLDACMTSLKSGRDVHLLNNGHVLVSPLHVFTPNLPALLYDVLFPFGLSIPQLRVRHHLIIVGQDLLIIKDLRQY
jgi:hypothetical protein